MIVACAEVRRATEADIDLLVPLFDGYRQFYRQPSDPDGARRFLTERLERRESIVFLAFRKGNAAGFVQLYPSFSSGAMRPIFILNDLFVASDGRRQGIGSALLQTAISYAKSSGAARLVLSTEISNATAQSLYEKLGWKRDAVFCSYHFTL
jgi:ribosomal protein S18 acetylase RimI-like enzyme